jgi:hypothetical protein
MHYFIVILIIAIIVFIQIRFFVNTKEKIFFFSFIFRGNGEYKLEKEMLIDEINSADDHTLNKMLKSAGLDCDEYNRFRGVIPVFLRKKAQNDLIDKLSATANGIYVKSYYGILETIVRSINDYLKNNKLVSDFHLMKDIVDRNCDAEEEEIDTQIPIPLYIGLVGTMAGILIGILYLWLSGGIDDLLSADTGAGADGVEALLGGVALAMISSILGIILTTWGSINFKNAKSRVGRDKHTFLSWIQAKLLPTLSDNVVGAIHEMTGNLSKFNKTFSSNIGNLDEALGKVNDSYLLQTQLLAAVQAIADKDLSMQNVQLLNALKSSVREIEKLAKYMQSVQEYSEMLHSSSKEIGDYFKAEREQIEHRKGVISQAVGKLDDYFQQALDKLKENIDTSITQLQNSIVRQQDILQRKTEEIATVVSELNQLSAIKESISKFAQTMQAQNDKLDKLTNSIYKLAEMKSTGTTEKFTVPLWAKILLITGVSIVSIACLTYLVPKIIQLLNSLFY